MMWIKKHGHGYKAVHSSCATVKLVFMSRDLILPSIESAVWVAVWWRLTDFGVWRPCLVFTYRINVENWIFMSELYIFVSTRYKNNNIYQIGGHLIYELYCKHGAVIKHKRCTTCKQDMLLQRRCDSLSLLLFRSFASSQFSKNCLRSNCISVKKAIVVGFLKSTPFVLRFRYYFLSRENKQSFYRRYY